MHGWHNVTIQVLVLDDEVVSSILAEPLIRIVIFLILVLGQQCVWRHLLHLHSWRRFKLGQILQHLQQECNTRQSRALLSFIQQATKHAAITSLLTLST